MYISRSIILLNLPLITWRGVCRLGDSGCAGRRRSLRSPRAAHTDSRARPVRFCTHSSSSSPSGVSDDDDDDDDDVVVVVCCISDFV